MIDLSILTVSELALCDHSSPGRFTALRGFAFLVGSFFLSLVGRSTLPVCLGVVPRAGTGGGSVPSQGTKTLFAQMRFLLARLERGMVKPDQQVS
mgnify:CR=1